MSDTATLIEEQQADYIEWLLIPKLNREPSNEAAYAKENGISRNQLRQWRTGSPQFVREWNRRIAEEASSPEKMQIVLDTLFRKIESGEATSSEHKLYLDQIALMNPPPKVSPDEASMNELTDSRLFEAVHDAAALNGWTVKVFDRDGTEIRIGA